MKGDDSDVLFYCDLLRYIKGLNCNFILRSLVPLAKTEKFAKDAMLSQTNICWDTAEFLVDLIFLPVRAETSLPYIQRHKP